jgi:hypothetical protein
MLRELAMAGIGSGAGLGFTALMSAAEWSKTTGLAAKLSSNNPFKPKPLRGSA